ncbi:hypothetical protein [Halocatena halophila]|uniref:hypothetical protein n=1 Tax=Halocatena halophila TaxID=2814576 RepID=UPI002ED51E07
MSNKSRSRRAVLGAIGAVALLGVTPAARATTDRIDTSFDPSSESAIRSFATNFRTLAPERRRTVFESLTTEQRTATKRAFAPERIEFDQNVSPQRTAQDTNVVRTARAKGWSLLGFHLWTWNHRASWSHEEDSVYDVQSSDFATVHDPTWAYKGTAAHSKDVDGDHFEVFRQGKLTFLGGRYTLSASPYARIRGNADGSSTVLAVDDGY